LRSQQRWKASRRLSSISTPLGDTSRPSKVEVKVNGGVHVQVQVQVNDHVDVNVNVKVKV